MDMVDEEEEQRGAEGERERKEWESKRRGREEGTMIE